VRAAWLGAAALTGLLCSCGSGEAPRAAAEPVRVEAPGLAAGSNAPVTATWREGDAERRVTLTPQPPLMPGFTCLGVTAVGSQTPLGRLVWGPPAETLVYHAASRVPNLAAQLLPNQVVLLRARPRSAPQPALWLTVDPREAPPVSLLALDRERAAQLLALAEALGAWDVLERDRFPAAATGEVFLPFFVARDPAGWEALHGASLAGFLPEPLATRVGGEPGLREASYAALRELVGELPQLADSLEELGQALAAANVAVDVSAARERITRHADRLGAYLASTWIESVITRQSADAARIELTVHTVVPIRLAGLELALGRREATLEQHAIAGLRLRDVATGTLVSAEARDGVLRLPLERRLRPHALGPYRFQSESLAYLLEGLERSPALGEQLLTSLVLRAADLRSGAPIPPDHVRRLVAVADPRFSTAAEESQAAFRAALGTRLVRSGGSPGATGPVLAADGSVLRVPTGRYELREDLILPRGTDLFLAQGVELRIRPGRSLLVRGRLTVAGTEQAPVRVHGAVAGEPWGVFAVQGAGARPLDPSSRRLVSSVRHLELAGGFEDALRGVRYTGQLAVHNQDLQLSHSTLRDAHGDDALNVKYGRVSIAESSFVDNLGDGVDLDWVEGELRRCTFARSGEAGDGLDVSGATISVEDSVFGDVGDKCVSVGERSQLTLRGSLLRRCAVGIASKDLSQTSVSESVFLDNQLDFAAYQKKQVFGGGRLRGEDLILIDPGRAPRRDPGSELALERVSWIRSDVDAGPGRAVGRDGLAETGVFSAAAFRALRESLPSPPTRPGAATRETTEARFEEE